MRIIKPERSGPDTETAATEEENALSLCIIIESVVYSCMAVFIIVGVIVMIIVLASGKNENDAWYII